MTDEDRLPREPIRAFIYGDGFASIDGAWLMALFLSKMTKAAQLQRSS